MRNMTSPEPDETKDKEDDETEEQKQLREKHHTEEDLKLIRELKKFKKQMQDTDHDDFF